MIDNERDKPAKPTVRPPQQGRSRETLERILTAAEKLLDGRDYEEISIQEICQAADVSPSSFYSRFSTKEALLMTLHERHRERRIGMLLTLAGERDWNATPIPEVVRAILGLYVEDRRALEPYLRSMMLAELRDPEIAQARAGVDHFAMTMIRDHLLGRMPSDDPGLTRRVEFGIRLVCAGAMDALQPPHRFADSMGIDDRELVEQLTRAFCVYVGADVTGYAEPAIRPAESATADESTNSRSD